MSAIDDFLDEHRLRPWPHYGPGPEVTDRMRLALARTCPDMTVGVIAGQGAPGAALYQSYREYMARFPDLKILGQPAFGAEVKARRWTGHERTTAGVTYAYLTAESRAERAAWAERNRLFYAGVRDPLLAESRERHRAAVHADGSNCAHSPSLEAMLARTERIDAAFRALVLDADQAAMLAASVEERYGAFIRWRPGDPVPEPTPGLAQWSHLHRMGRAERGEVPDQGAGPGQGLEVW